MTIVKAVANKENTDQNCVLISRVIKQLDGGSVVAYILFINNKPVDHTVSFDIALNWYDRNAGSVANPVEVVEVGHYACGTMYVRETR